jgi:hypothetical protein
MYSYQYKNDRLSRLARDKQAEGKHSIERPFLSAGSLLTVYRVSSPGPYFQSRSTSGGRVWSPPVEMPGCHSVDPSLEIVHVDGAVRSLFVPFYSTENQIFAKISSGQTYRHRKT